MKLLINGQERELDVSTLASLLDKLEARPPFAVGLNTAFVPRSQYPLLILKEGDAVEVVQAMSGG